jgi:hypothetical protein
MIYKRRKSVSTAACKRHGLDIIYIYIDGMNRGTDKPADIQQQIQKVFDAYCYYDFFSHVAKSCKHAALAAQVVPGTNRSRVATSLRQTRPIEPEMYGAQPSKMCQYSRLKLPMRSTRDNLPTIHTRTFSVRIALRQVDQYKCKIPQARLHNDSSARLRQSSH